MPSSSNIVINDGATTPVAHTYSPSGQVGLKANWQEIVNGVPIGYPKVSVEFRSLQVPESGAYKVTIKLNKPKVISVTDTTGKTVTTVDYDNLAVVEFMVAARSQKQERKDLRVLLANLLQNAQIVSAIDDLEFFW